MLSNTARKIAPDPYQDSSLTLVSANDKISCVYMEAADIKALIAIQAEIHGTLTKEYHLKKRSPADLEAHLENGKIIGAKLHPADTEPDQGTLLGACLLSFMRNR